MKYEARLKKIKEEKLTQFAEEERVESHFASRLCTLSFGK